MTLANDLKVFNFRWQSGVQFWVAVHTLGEAFRTYKTSKAYQNELKKLQGKYPYRLDTNYAKIDRIEHPEIEAFKTDVENMIYKGRSVKEWKRIASFELDDARLIDAIKELLI